MKLEDVRETLAGMVAEIFELESPEAVDGALSFEFVGDSLQHLELVAAISHRFGIEIDYHTIATFDELVTEVHELAGQLEGR